MDSKTVEKYDRQRYLLMLMFGVLYLLSKLPGYIAPAEWEFTSVMIQTPFAIAILFLVLRFAAMDRKIKRDPELRRALNNEMHKSYRNRSFVIAFAVVMATAACFPLTRIYGLDISASELSKFILDVGIISFFTAWLIYNR